MIECASSLELQIHNISYVNLSNIKFRKCQFIIQYVDNFFLVNVEISDLTVMFNSAFKLLQTSANIIASMFTRITAINSGALIGGIINTNNGNLTIKNSTLKDCSEFDGTALLAVQNSNITITGCRFMNMELMYGISHSTGAVFHFGEKCSADICNCTFSNNTAINLTNETFYQVGIIHAYGNLNISLCYFTGNYGGIIAMQGVNIERSVFRNHSAQCGAAVYTEGSEGSISECLFISNIALDYGGALALDGKMNVIGCTFHNNYARIGGALGSQSHVLNVSRCVFIKNEAYESGGALYFSFGNLFAADNAFYYNNAASGGALYAYDIDSISISKSNFTSNEATFESGGAIMTELDYDISDIDHWLVNISKCIFMNNTAIHNGGGIHVDNVHPGIDLELNFVKNKFIHNQATLHNGGALAVMLSITLIITENDFQSNKAVNGGAIFIITFIDETKLMITKI